MTPSPPERPVKSRLGRGLESLIPVAPEQSGGDGVPQYIAIDQIQPSPEQQRKHFAADQLRELADSIREHGVLQPLLVSRLGNGYELIAGERRWRAARLAGLEKVPAIVRAKADARDSLLLGLIENLQREDLDPIEEARGIRRLVDSFGLTHEEAAARLGKHRVAVSQALRLLNGCPALLSAAASGAVSAGHARALVGLPSPADQEHGLKVVLAKRFSVRQTERWVQNYQPQVRQQRSNPRQQADSGPLRELQEKLSGRYGDAVAIAGSIDAGRITLTYANRDELNSLLRMLFG
jgi:ParB family chromosome partitioning protein